MVRPQCTLLSLVLLTGCVDSDKVSWVVISNPSGGTVPVQGGLVISWRRGTRDLTILGRSAEADDPVVLRLRETGGPRGDEPGRSRTLYLGVDSDHLLILEGVQGEFHSSALVDGRVELDGVSGLEVGPDSATALRFQAAGGRWHLAAGGNLYVHETPAGVFVSGPDRRQQVFPAGSLVEPAGTDYLIVEPGARRTLVRVPPSIPAGSQAEFDAGHDSYRFRSYAGALSAELPADRFRVFAPSAAIRLDGNFPDGAGGALDSPFRAVLVRRNHHLLLIRAAGQSGLSSSSR